MKFLKLTMSILLLGSLTLSCHSGERSEDSFKYLADSFADIKVIRYRIPGWEALSLKQKEYIYHLSEAAKSGRDIFWTQNFKYGLKIRKSIETIFEKWEGEREGKEWEDFVIYAKRLFFSSGIHHHYGEEKFIPECSREYFGELLKGSGQEAQIEELLPILYNPDLYRFRKNISGEGDLLLGSSVNFYSGVSKSEAESFYKEIENPNDSRPLSYGLNSKLVKRDGELVEEFYSIEGLYGAAIEEIVKHLQKAMECAENSAQREYISLLIEYYKSGSLELWDRYNVAWVQEGEGRVDFINGFIETYNDPLGMKATWESVVNFKDEEASKRSETISENAQWFEDNSPVEERFKKSEVVGVTAKVITVAQLGGDCHPTSPIGINLPNADWIRKEYGSKSVTMANISEAYERAAQESPKNMSTEFSWDEQEIELLKSYSLLTGNIHTDLHECLGHGSGQLLAGVSSNALKEFSSPLEEARADLFALYYIADQKMIDLGILPNSEAYKAEYISYIRNGLFTQFVRVDLGKKVTQAHMQARKLISEWSYEKGKERGAIEKRVRDGKHYFVINDYQIVRELFGELLGELQRIKSEGDYNAGKELIERYAIDIDPNLHKEVKERYEKLELKPYGGFINPDITPLVKKGKVVDYVVSYPTSFLEQMLEYGKRYSFL
ncbi:MAG: dihydrofolate reductase [Bacteroidales bacterium]